MKYSEEIIETICKHLKQGATITAACNAVGITRQTFYNWMESKFDVFDSIKKAMAVPDKKVENALFKSATMGHRYREREYTTVPSKDGSKLIKILSKETVKVIAPSVTAQIFWLKNRLPEEWKDKQDIDLSGSLDVGITAADIWEARKRAEKKFKKKNANNVSKSD